MLMSSSVLLAELGWSNREAGEKKCTRKARIAVAMAVLRTALYMASIRAECWGTVPDGAHYKTKLGCIRQPQSDTEALGAALSAAS